MQQIIVKTSWPKCVINKNVIENPSILLSDIVMLARHWW